MFSYVKPAAMKIPCLRRPKQEAGEQVRTYSMEKKFKKFLEILMRIISEACCFFSKSVIKYE
jgi:hypothetical protein